MTSSPQCVVLRRQTQRSEPWRNGGGTTRTVAIDPPGADLASGFRWRISIADVAVAGPFSILNGIDRSLWLLAGKGMELRCDGAVTTLQSRLSRLDFAGEAPIVGIPIDGPVRDLNVMTKRGEVLAAAVVADAGALAAFSPEPFVDAPQRVLLVLAGALGVVTAGGARAELAEGDAVHTSLRMPLRPVALDPATELLAVGFWPARG